MALSIGPKSAGQTFSASEFNTLETFVNGLETSIGTNTSLIATNTSGVSSNASSISTNASGVSTNAGNITTNATGVSTNAGNISTNTSAISTNAGNISTNASAISTNSGNISTNTSSISTNAGNISTNTSDLSSHTSDAGKHREINDSGYASTDLWSADKNRKANGIPIVTLDDDSLDYVLDDHSNRLIICTAPTANRDIDIEDGDVTQPDTFRILAKTDSGFEYRITESGTMSLSDFEGNALTSPYALEDGMYLVHLDNATDTAYIQKFGSGSGGGATSGVMSFFEAYKSGLQTVTTAGGWGDVVLWTQGGGTDTGIFSFNATTGELTINTTAPCLFVLDVAFNDTANNRVEGWIGLSIDSGGGHSLATRYTLPAYASRNNTTIDEAGLNFSAIVDVTSGDKFLFQTKVEGANADILDDMARFYVVALTGTVGPTGPAGGNEKLDGVFRINNSSDATKQVDFDVSAVGASTKRTISVPNNDVDLADIATNTSAISGITYFGAFSNAVGGTWGGTLKSRKDGDDIVQVLGELTVSNPPTTSTGALISAHRPAIYTTRIVWNETTGTAIEVFMQTSGVLAFNGGDINANDKIKVDFQFEK